LTAKAVADPAKATTAPATGARTICDTMAEEVITALAPTRSSSRSTRAGTTLTAAGVKNVDMADMAKAVVEGDEREGRHPAPDVGCRHDP
jgi:hypothetical protein